MVGSLRLGVRLTLSYEDDSLMRSTCIPFMRELQELCSKRLEKLASFSPTGMLSHDANVH